MGSEVVVAPMFFMVTTFNPRRLNFCLIASGLSSINWAILPLPKKIHDATGRLQTLEEVEAYFPGFKAFIDATEQEIPRPSAKLKRKTHYSGKKKKHTVKTQITVNKDGLIIHKTRKKALGPFRKEIMGLPQHTRDAIAAELETNFCFLFKQLNVVNKRLLANK